MIYYVSCDARDGDGSPERPFGRIQEAADIAKPGDEVIVAPGIYRECVMPENGGTGDDARITYRSEVPLSAVITGAEKLEGWEPAGGTLWKVSVPNSMFGDYNPYTTVLCGDWYYGKKIRHTGELYLNGKAMYEADDTEQTEAAVPGDETSDPEFSIYQWCTVQNGTETEIWANFHEYDPNRECVEFNVRRECFCPEREGVNYITVSGFTIRQAATTWAPPTAYQDGMVAPRWSKGWIIEDCDISDSRCSGISLGKYLQPDNENKWSTKFYKHGTQTEREAVCEAQADGWSKDTVGSHIIRRCHIHDCGQTGIVGHLGGIFSLIEDNEIDHINNRRDLEGAEIGGIKMHAAIDVIFRRNHIHHCTRGMWLDWQAQGTRVTQNLFHDNSAPPGIRAEGQLKVGEDIFIEVSHGPTLVDNNVMLSRCAARISAQGIAFVHNLICGSFTAVGEGTDNHGATLPSQRYTPYHFPHRTEVAGFMTFLHGDVRFCNNIFIQTDVPATLVEGTNYTCGTEPYDGYPSPEEYFAAFDAAKEGGVSAIGTDIYYKPLPVYTEGNVYLNGAKPCDTERSYAVGECGAFLEYSDGTLKTDIYDIPCIWNNGYDGSVSPEDAPCDDDNAETLPEKRVTQIITTGTLGEAFEPEQLFEMPDGSPIVFDEDYFGNKRGSSPLPGPFAEPGQIYRLTDAH